MNLSLMLLNQLCWSKSGKLHQGKLTKVKRREEKAQKSTRQVERVPCLCMCFSWPNAPPKLWIMYICSAHALLNSNYSILFPFPNMEPVRIAFSITVVSGKTEQHNQAGGP